MSKIWILAVLLGCGVAQVAHYELVLLDDPAALCLDGSPGAYYLSVGEEPDKVLIHFEGGGWCGGTTLAATLESCYQRSLTTLGSSKTYPATLDISGGMLSNQQMNSFRKWTKVFFKYCDGAGHQGSRQAPLSYKGTNLFFRGNNITYAKLHSLDQKIGFFTRTSQVIVSGASAGGLATFLWADEINRLVSTDQVWAAPDSGVFLNEENVQTRTHTYELQFSNLLSISNTESSAPTPECLKEFSDKPQLCMFAENLFRYIKTPIFAIQSLYDSWSIPNIIHVGCIAGSSLQKCSAAERTYIEEYHMKTSALLRKMAADPKNGYWAPVCVDHVYTWGGCYFNTDFRVPRNSANSADVTLMNWIKGEGDVHTFMDDGEWPDNTPCAGLSQLSSLSSQ